ncbi:MULTISPECIES: thiol:disulfide interchange protein DsbA/DsbL [Azotobacter]|uniref:thiol:disulfide interchange protein DsbA/DsbL n=1 Tax=Azotobacter TaxID=352 RepID=UPI000ABF7463|nr:thiol:disulfide interchange protein DsbA/DsbL [Azotobacter vinelandii]GLK61996.1 thiol:disulfide interchange protein [Azotobacter vinelandii]
MFKFFWVGLFLVVINSTSSAQEFIAGKDYYIIEPERLEYSGSIIEFFNYACMYCYRVETDIDRLYEHLPEKISFERIPVVMGKKYRYEPAAIASYILKFNGLESKYHKYMFQVIRSPLSWELKKYNRLSEKSYLQIFFEDLGLSAEKYQDSYIYAQKKLSDDRERFKTLALTGTPTFLVRGKYIVSGLRPEPYAERHLVNTLIYLLRLE